MTDAARSCLVAIILMAGGCTAADPEPARAGAANIAVFAGGCFWTMEHKFSHVPGVIDVRSGAADSSPNVTIESFERGDTDQVEAVEVIFDPSRISYRQLVDRYWGMIDPTDAGGQACDRGSTYKTAIFTTAQQQPDALASRQAAAARIPNMRIVTSIRPAAFFTPAPDYHQNFAETQPERYKRYDKGCNRAGRLAAVWGKS